MIFHLQRKMILSMNNDKQKTVQLHLSHIQLENLKYHLNEDDNSNTVRRTNTILNTRYELESNKYYIIIKEIISGPVELSLELSGTYEVDSSATTKEDLEKVLENTDKVEQICFPLLSESSAIIAFMTGKALGVPLIVPPVFQKDEDGE